MTTRDNALQIPVNCEEGGVAGLQRGPRGGNHAF